MDGHSERWLPVVGYEKLYEVSDLGRVKRIGGGTNGARVGRILKQNAARGGKYRAVSLAMNGACKRFSVHSLVMSAFVGPRPQGLEIDHINNIKHDNCLVNLEYVTSSENKLRALRTGAWVVPSGSRHGASKLTEEEVSQVRELLSQIKRGELILSRRKLGKRFGVSHQCIHYIDSGRCWGHLQAASA